MDLQEIDHRLVLTSTKRGRTTLAICAVFILGLASFPVISSVFVPGFFSDYGWLIFVCTPLYGVLGGWCLYGAGPTELMLDLDNRTYELRRGFAWRPKTWTGSFADIKGIHIEGSGRSIVTYCVMLDWKWNLNRRAVPLFISDDRDLATAKMAELCARLNLPRDTVW